MNCNHTIPYKDINGKPICEGDTLIVLLHTSAHYFDTSIRQYSQHAIEVKRVGNQTYYYNSIKHDEGVVHWSPEDCCFAIGDLRLSRFAYGNKSRNHGRRISWRGKKFLIVKASHD